MTDGRLDLKWTLSFVLHTPAENRPPDKGDEEDGQAMSHNVASKQGSAEVGVAFLPYAQVICGGFHCTST